MGKLEPAAFESLERIGHSLVSQLRRRLEMVALEITEEQIRFGRVLGWQLVALFLSCLSFALIVVLVIAAYWDGPQRLVAIGSMLGLTAAAAGAVWWLYRRDLSRKPMVFAQTIEELRRDAEALRPQPRADMDAIP